MKTIILSLFFVFFTGTAFSSHSLMCLEETKVCVRYTSDANTGRILTLIFRQTDVAQFGKEVLNELKTVGIRVEI